MPGRATLANLASLNAASAQANEPRATGDPICHIHISGRTHGPHVHGSQLGRLCRPRADLAALVVGSYEFRKLSHPGLAQSVAVTKSGLNKLFDLPACCLPRTGTHFELLLRALCKTS